MTNETRDEAILLIHYFYELPGGDILETAKRYGLDPDGPAVDLVCDAFEYLFCISTESYSEVRALDYHRRCCLEAANLLESGWTKSAAT